MKTWENLSPSPWRGGGRGWGAGGRLPRLPRIRRESRAALQPVRSTISAPHPPPPPHQGEGRRSSARRPQFRLGQAGFSLVEVLIALFITALLTGLGTSLLLSTIAGKERFDGVAAGARELELAHSTLKTDLSQLSARPVRAPNGVPREAIFAGGAAAPDGGLLAFSRAGWDNPDGVEPRGSVVYVEYRLDEDRLVRRSFVRADPTERTPAIERVLLTGVEAARVEFSRQGVWTDVYAVTMDRDAAGSFPDLVALDLTLTGVGQVRQVFLTGYPR